MELTCYVVKNLKTGVYVSKKGLDAKRGEPRLFRRRNNASASITHQTRSYYNYTSPYTPDDFEIIECTVIIPERELTDRLYQTPAERSIIRGGNIEESPRNTE